MGNNRICWRQAGTLPAFELTFKIFTSRLHLPSSYRTGNHIVVVRQPILSNVTDYDFGIASRVACHLAGGQQLHHDGVMATRLKTFDLENRVHQPINRLTPDAAVMGTALSLIRRRPAGTITFEVQGVTLSPSVARCVHPGCFSLFRQPLVAPSDEHQNNYPEARLKDWSNQKSLNLAQIKMVRGESSLNRFPINGRHKCFGVIGACELANMQKQVFKYPVTNGKGGMNSFWSKDAVVLTRIPPTTHKTATS